MKSVEEGSSIPRGNMDENRVSHWIQKTCFSIRVDENSIALNNIVQLNTFKQVFRLNLLNEHHSFSVSSIFVEILVFENIFDGFFDFSFKNITFDLIENLVFEKKLPFLWKY